MRVSDILRQMADVVDQVEGGEQAVQQPAVAQEPVVQEPVVQEPVAQEPVAVPAIQGELEAPCDAADNDELTMVSPLQQEHELLKKSQGVNNSVSEFAGDEQADDGYQSELAAMQQAAGIGEEKANKAAHEEQRQMEDQLNPRRNAAIAARKARSERSE